MARKPKTITEWRKERLAKAKQEKGYILIPMELWNGEAFHGLKKAEKLVLLEGLSQLRYAPGGKKKRSRIPEDQLFECGLGCLLNRGEFGLPTKYLQERGIKGEDTIARAKKRLVQVGFMDVVTQGDFSHAGRFRYSDRWRTYNASELCNVKEEPYYEAPTPGYCKYPNIIKYNETRILQDVHAHETYDESDEQLNLFYDYDGLNKV